MLCFPSHTKHKHNTGTQVLVCLSNVESDRGERCQEEEGHKHRRLLGSVTQVSGAASQAVAINSVAHVASHAVFADQIV